MLSHLDDLLLVLGERDLEGVAAVVEELGGVAPLLLHGGAPLPLVEEAVHLVNLPLQPLQLRVVGLTLLE